MDATKLMLIAGLMLAGTNVNAAPLPPGQPNLAAQDDSGDSNSDNITAVQSPQFGGTCLTDGASIMLHVDGADALPATTCAGGVYAVSLQGAMVEGSHSVTATAADSGGTSAPSIATVVTIDVTPPALSITSGPSGNVSDRDASFAFTVGEGRPTQCALDTSAFAPCTSPKDYTALADGVHSFAVQASDVAGNMTSMGVSWTVGPQPAPGPPMLDASSDSGRSHADYLTNATTLLFIGNCFDGDSMRLYDAGALVGGPTVCSGNGYGINVTGLAEGTHTISATTTRNGFESPSSPAATVTIDRTPPQPPVITGPPAGASAPNVLIQGTAEPYVVITVHDGQTVHCLATTKAPGNWNCSGNFTTAGEHQLTVSADDFAGNTSALSSPAYIVTVDLLFRNGFE